MTNSIKQGPKNVLKDKLRRNTCRADPQVVIQRRKSKLEVGSESRKWKQNLEAGIGSRNRKQEVEAGRGIMMQEVNSGK